MRRGDRERRKVIGEHRGDSERKHRGDGEAPALSAPGIACRSERIRERRMVRKLHGALLWSGFSHQQRNPTKEAHIHHHCSLRECKSPAPPHCLPSRTR